MCLNIVQTYLGLCFSGSDLMLDFVLEQPPKVHRCPGALWHCSVKAGGDQTEEKLCMEKITAILIKVEDTITRRCGGFI